MRDEGRALLINNNKKKKWTGITASQSVVLNIEVREGAVKVSEGCILDFWSRWLCSRRDSYWRWKGNLEGESILHRMRWNGRRITNAQRMFPRLVRNTWRAGAKTHYLWDDILCLSRHLGFIEFYVFITGQVN